METISFENLKSYTVSLEEETKEERLSTVSCKMEFINKNKIKFTKLQKKGKILKVSESGKKKVFNYPECEFSGHCLLP